MTTRLSSTSSPTRRSEHPRCTSLPCRTDPHPHRNHPRTALHQRCQLLLAEGELERCHRGVMACHRTGLARNLPETTPHVTSPRPTAQPSAAPLTSVVVWVREVLRGVVNSPSINGMQGVRAIALDQAASRLSVHPWPGARHRPAAPKSPAVCPGSPSQGRAAFSSIGPDCNLVLQGLVAQHELAVPAGDVQLQPTGDSLALMQRQLIQAKHRLESG